MSDRVTAIEISDPSSGVKTVEVRVPGIQGPVGPASVFMAATPAGTAEPAAMTFRPVSEGSDIYEIHVSTPE